MKGKTIKIIIGAAVIAVIAILGYSLSVTLKQDPGAGTFTCLNDGTCIWTAHIHAYFPIMICGEEYRLPIEHGPLDDPHSHEEKNIVHWHDKLPYDPETQSILDTKPLTVGAFFDSIDVNFSENQIAQKRNGDQCAKGESGAVKMFVNGKHNNQFRDYIWRDKDVILIIFDDRSIETIEEELRNNPITFPKLGLG